MDLLTIFLFVVVIIAIVVAWFLLEYLKNKGKDESEKLPYSLRPYFLNKSEEAFFLELKKVLPDGYHIFSKVRMIDFIKPIGGIKWRNKIMSKHVDFLICDQQSKPMVVIEVDDKSHKNAKVKGRDDFKDRVLNKVGLKIKRVPVGSNFSEIVQTIFSDRD